MQIDELPAGEQTRHPDLDMNQVVGTHDILMLCFDTLRYDVSKKRKKRPEERLYWTAMEENGRKDMLREIFTLPVSFAIFAGFLLPWQNLILLRSRNWLFFPVQAGTGRASAQRKLSIYRSDFCAESCPYRLWNDLYRWRKFL